MPNQRSQHQNRASALKILKSRLYELELRKIEEKEVKICKKKGNRLGASN